MIRTPSQFIPSNCSLSSSFLDALITAQPMLLVPKSNPKMCFGFIALYIFPKAMNFLRQNLSFQTFSLTLFSLI